MNRSDSTLLYLGLDLGTTNVKALVCDSAGRILGRAAAPVALCHTGVAGVEQEFEEIWSATLKVLQETARSFDSHRLSALGISSQGGAMLIRDARGRPLGRVISWLDQRGAAYDGPLTTALGRRWFVERLGHGHSGLAIGQVLRLREESPDWLSPAHRIGFVGDAVVERLCGRAAHDSTSLGLTLLHNPQQRRADPDILERLQLDNRQLPDLLRPREIAGRLRPEVAQATGLPSGIPVSPAIHDQYAAALGVGAVRSGQVMFGAGTAWVLLAVMDHWAPPVIDDAYVCSHVVDGLFGQIVSLVNGGSALAWARRLLGLGHEPDDRLDSRLQSVPAGSHGLCFWPFLSASSPSGLPPNTRGRLANLQLAHSADHVLRAVIEGLGCELNRHLQFLQQAALPTDHLVMVGRAAASQCTPRIIADISGLPVTCAATPEGSALGAAILARGLTEPQRSLAELSAEMTPPGRLVAPGEDAPLYRQLVERYQQSLPVSAESAIL